MVRAIAIYMFAAHSSLDGVLNRKVAFVLEELGLSYESVYLDFNKGEHKAPEFLKFNPNGRVPAIVDHKNNDFILWYIQVIFQLWAASHLPVLRESNAIIQYIADKYDTERKISIAANDDQKYVEQQWLYFQASGQGPYFGQVAWFLRLHPEKVPSAVERYRNEVKRVLSVLESVLSKQEWLVGGRLTIADITFVP